MNKVGIFLALFGGIVSSAFSLTPGASSPVEPKTSPPIVYTIAGSDSGGGAGIQADLHAIHAMNCHGCSAITCLTAQNSVGVSAVHAPEAKFLRQQLDTLMEDLPPKAIKIGMLATQELTDTVGDVLQAIKQKDEDVKVVLDPVMISTSGSKLISDDAVSAMLRKLFPLADVVTPNKFEAEALLGRELRTPKDIEVGARELLRYGCKAVLIKGGHTLAESTSGTVEESPQVRATLDYAQDYLLVSETPPAEGDERLCDGCRGVWLRSARWDTDNTHGTGCTLSSAIASALALGVQKRQDQGNPEGATSTIETVDACCLAKAYVSAGIQSGVRLGKGPGPVAQTEFPASHLHFPEVALDATSVARPFLSMKKFSSGSEDDSTPVLGRILPVVDTVEWVERLAKTLGVTDIQLRIKDEKDPAKIRERVSTCQLICNDHGVRLWINDHWEAAIEAGCFGVHVGQEDLMKCVKSGGINQLQKKNLALGVSTHSYSELAATLGVRPSYISLGPVFATSSKQVKFDPQGLGILHKWRTLIPPEIPLVAIGGINDLQAAAQCRDAGADCVAVIGAITKTEDVDRTVERLNRVMREHRPSHPYKGC